MVKPLLIKTSFLFFFSMNLTVQNSPVLKSREIYYWISVMLAVAGISV